MTWKDNSSNESGFYVERSTNGASWTRIATVAANTGFYTNTGLSSSRKYYYRVRAYNSSGTSSYTNTVTATTPATSQPLSNVPRLSLFAQRVIKRDDLLNI